MSSNKDNPVSWATKPTNATTVVHCKAVKIKWLNTRRMESATRLFERLLYEPMVMKAPKPTPVARIACSIAVFQIYKCTTLEMVVQNLSSHIFSKN